MARWGWAPTEETFKIPPGQLKAIVFKNSQGNHVTVYGPLHIYEFIVLHREAVGISERASVSHKRRHELRTILSPTDNSRLEDAMEFGSINLGYVIIVTGDDPEAAK